MKFYLWGFFFLGFLAAGAGGIEKTIYFWEMSQVKAKILQSFSKAESEIVFNARPVLISLIEENERLLFQAKAWTDQSTCSTSSSAGEILWESTIELRNIRLSSNSKALVWCLDPVRGVDQEISKDITLELSWSGGSRFPQAEPESLAFELGFISTTQQ